jgi:hypothetical protein
MSSHAARRPVLGEILSQLLNVPVMSGVLLTFFFLHLSNEPNLGPGYLWSMLFMCLLPLCSLFFYIPGKTREREKILHRQRWASFVLMIISYPSGALVLHLIKAPKIFRALAVIYSLVTIGLIIFNLFIHYKASGHAAGVAGPVISMVYLYGWVAAPLLLLLPLVTWARVSANGHSFWQTVVGACLSLVITISVLYGYGFLPFIGQIN